MTLITADYYNINLIAIKLMMEMEPDQYHNPNQRPQQYTTCSYIISVVDSLIFLATLLELAYLFYTNYAAMQAPPQYTAAYLHPTLNLDLKNPVLEFAILSPEFGDPTDPTNLIQHSCYKFNVCYQYTGKIDVNQTTASNASWSDIHLYDYF